MWKKIAFSIILPFNLLATPSLYAEETGNQQQLDSLNQSKPVQIYPIKFDLQWGAIDGAGHIQSEAWHKMGNDRQGRKHRSEAAV